MLLKHWLLRTPIGVAAIATLTLVASGAGAATVHRLVVGEATGSAGAMAVLQSDATMSAIQAEVNAAPTQNFTIPFAGAGFYDPPSSTNPPFGIGIVGLSTTGYGVAGETFSASPAILALNAGTGDGIDVAANNASGVGVLATATRTALYGNSSSRNGVYGITSSPYASGVVGYNQSQSTNFSGGGTGVAGTTTVIGGFGVFGGGYNGTDAGVVGEAEYGTSKSMPGFTAAVIGTTYTIGEDLFEGDVDDIESFAVSSGSANASGTVTNNPSAYGSDISDNGDLYLTGAVYTHCTTFPYPEARDCTKGADAEPASDGSMRETYASRHASPTMEDDGETRLNNGFAHVVLDSAYASMISKTAPYLVFVTAQGDNRGLYVAHVTPGGFDVRESGGGHSTMTVDYRIVARPFADATQRFAIARTATMRPQSATAKALFHKRIANGRDSEKELTQKSDMKKFASFRTSK